MQYFLNGKINLSSIKDKEKFLYNLSYSLSYLCCQSEYESFLICAGVYHKNYYEIIERVFLSKKITVFAQKNVEISEFLYNLKQNMCKYGIYFFEENKQLYLKIFSGNGFLVDINQQNFIEKNLLSQKLFCQNDFSKKNFINFYERNILGKMKKFFFDIKSENLYLKEKLERYNLVDKSSKILIKINKDLTYNILKDNKNYDVELPKIFNKFLIKESAITEEKLIEEINLNQLKNVVNSRYLMYNKFTNYFDIFTTLEYLSKYIQKREYDKNSTKLV